MNFKFFFYIIAVLFFLSSCSHSFNEEQLEKVKVGDRVEDVLSDVGEASHIDSIERWKYLEGADVDIKDGKVQNYFLSKQLENHPVFSKIRIGMSDEEIVKLAGKPFDINHLQRLYYREHQQLIIKNLRVYSIDLHSFQDLTILDKIRLNFNGESMFIINLSLAVIMFGVALDIRLEHFKQVLKNPKSLGVGVFSQFILLPALTFGLIMLIKPTASVAMGMILVAACPGGNISNFMTSWAKGNSALSISLTAIATIAAIFATPLNFSFWGALYANTSSLLIPIEIDWYQMLKTVVILLGIPVVAGLLFRHYFEKTAVAISKSLRIFSIVFFIGLIIGAMSLNIEFIIRYLHLIALLVLLHNFVAIASGYTLARVFKLPNIDRRTISIETGIQNSGLALVLIFNPKLFDGLGGMAFIAAFWGIWHIVSGLIISSFWRRIKY
jgi:BASS family bile acid:Na+ symporter